MRNRTYGGVRGRKTKVGRKLLRFPPTRLWGRANEIPPRSQMVQKFSYHLVTSVTGANFLLKGSFSAFCVDLHSCR